MKAGIRVAATLTAALFLVPSAAAPADDPGALRLLADRVAGEYASANTAVDLEVAKIGTLPIPLTFPSSACIVGELVRRPVGEAYGTYRYTEYHVYLDTAQPSDALVQAIVSSAATAGYVPFTSSIGTVAGGFVTAPTTTVLCKDGSTDAIAIRSGNSGARAEVTVTISIPAATNAPFAGTQCGGRPRTTFGDPAGLPVIRQIDGARVERRSTSGAVGFSEQTADVYTELAPRALLDAWSKQLVADGWTASSPAVNDTAGIATFRGSIGGLPRLASLSVLRAGAGRLIASVRSVQMEPSSAASGR